MKKIKLIQVSLLSLGLLGLACPFASYSLNDQTYIKCEAAAQYTLKAYPNGGTLKSTTGWTINTESNVATKPLSLSDVVTTFPAVSRTGYSLDWWYTASTGGTKIRSTGYTITKNTSIYAQWIPNTYTITFDRQSGTGGTSSATATYDSVMPSITVPTRTGYTFQGYYTGTGGSGTKYYSNKGICYKDYTFSSNTTLYAYWTANNYSVTLDQQSGFGGTSSTTATYDSAMPAITIPSRTGYTFQGYYSGTEGTGTKYYSAQGKSAHLYDLPSGTTLYACWAANSYPITYKDQGNVTFSGTHETEYPSLHIYGTVTPLKNATKTGFIFGGWYTSSDCSGSPVTSLGAEDYLTGITLFALWSEDSSFKPVLVNSIGGHINDNGTNKQFIAFGFQVNSNVYNSLVNNTDFGIIAYKSGSAQIEYSNGNIADLIINEGRFYIYMIVESQNPITYYAKAFVKYSGTYIYSELVSATGNLSGLPYVLE